MALDPLTADVARDPLNFFRTRTVNPPANQDATYRRTSPVDLSPPHLRFFSAPRAVGPQWQFTSAQLEPQVAWIRFRPDYVYTDGVSFDVEFAAPHANPADYTDVSADFEQRAAAADRLPVWYLPWEPDHLVRLTIPRYRAENLSDFGDAVHIDPYNPHLFFTAGLTGCSVFAYGDPRSPTVVHVGTRGSTPYGDECARFWRELLLLERFQRLRHIGLAHEVNVDDYMGTSANFMDFLAWIRRLPSEFIVEHAAPFGSIFGIRYGGLWSFYLQENVFVKRFKLVKGKKKVSVPASGISGFFGKKVLEDIEIEVKSRPDYLTRPISVRPFFPHGGQATFWQTFRQAYA